MARFEALRDYWQKHPPAHLLIAGYLGYKPKPAHEPPAPLPEIEE